MSDARPSAFACAFCEVEDTPQVLKDHLIDQHASEIAGQHWGTHIHRVAGENKP